MSEVTVTYEEYSPVKGITKALRSDIDSLLDGVLSSDIEEEIIDCFNENQDKTITAVLGYGGSNDGMICFDLKDESGDLNSWVLGPIKTIHEESG